MLYDSIGQFHKEIEPAVQKKVMVGSLINETTKPYNCGSNKAVIIPRFRFHFLHAVM
jgi:hypothetical protein